MKRILRYLKGTRELGIIYRPELQPETNRDDQTIPWGYCDANYAEDTRDQKSTSGYGFMLANGSIAWKSKKQASVALSTTEAEYYALGMACQEAVWLKQIFQELYLDFRKSIHIYSDNTGAVALLDNPVYHSQLKHIDICWHYI